MFWLKGITGCVSMEKRRKTTSLRNSRSFKHLGTPRREVGLRESFERVEAQIDREAEKHLKEER